MSREGQVARMLRRALERASRSGPAMVPEYPLDVTPRWGWAAPELAPVTEMLESRRSEYEEAVDDVCGLLDWARTIPRVGADPGQPQWDNDYWGTVDALMQVASLRRRDPLRYVEIGSGWSTLFARRAISDFGLRTRITSIDPAPRAEVDAACDEVIRQGLESVGGEPFAELEAGDVVVMDGSHTALMNSDSVVFMLEILPTLAPGVLVAIDDVFLPLDYPPTWEGRVYGEQYLLAAFLLGGAGGWSVRFPGWWLCRTEPYKDRFGPLWPVIQNRFMHATATSFWLERDT